MDDVELGQLFERYGYLVHRRCSALLQGSAEAEDALQEVFLRVRRYGDQHRGKSILPWLYAVAFNVCCDLMKRRQREQLAEPEVLARADGRSQGSGDEADRRAVVGGVLRGLDRRTREIAVLHHVEGLTQEEVAAATGYSRRTVGKKLQEFAEGLRRAWRPMEVVE